MSVTPPCGAGRADGNPPTRFGAGPPVGCGAGPLARQRDEPLAFLRRRDLFGDLADDERFVREDRWALDALHRHGGAATPDSLNHGIT